MHRVCDFGGSGEDVRFRKGPLIRFNIRLPQSLSWLCGGICEYAIKGLEEECVGIKEKNAVIIQEFEKPQLDHDISPPLVSRLDPIHIKKFHSNDGSAFPGQLLRFHSRTPGGMRTMKGIDFFV
jgi:hypothetical protein